MRYEICEIDEIDFAEDVQAVIGQSHNRMTITLDNTKRIIARARMTEIYLAFTGQL